MNHPAHAEWMDYLYDEVAPARKSELQRHLKQCPGCARELEAWRESMHALDKFELPPGRRPHWAWLRGLRFAAAAALVLATGVVIGRHFSTSAADLAGLRSSVADLRLAVQMDQSISSSNAVFAATTAANEETIRLLGNYSRAQEDKRAADRQAFGLALKAFENQLARVSGDLETVAVNTQTGFQETHQNLSQLVSFVGPYPPPNQK